MNELVRSELRPCSQAQIDNLEELGRAVEKLMETNPKEIRTEHHLHAGVYSRTLYVPANTIVVGLLIKVPTQLIACGDFELTDGGKVIAFRGYHIFDGAPYRQAAVRTHKPSAFTMLFATNAKTVEEAENEFTDEPERLLTRKEKLVCRVVG